MASSTAKGTLAEELRALRQLIRAHRLQHHRAPYFRRVVECHKLGVEAASDSEWLRRNSAGIVNDAPRRRRLMSGAGGVFGCDLRRDVTGMTGIGARPSETTGSDGRPRSAFASESRRGGEWCAVSGRAVSGSDCVSRTCDVRETRESDDSASAPSDSTSCAL